MYAELHCHSYFSLLDGASSPEALVAEAARLGLSALALTDHDSLAGAVRFWTAAQRADLHAILGAEVTLEDGSHLTLLAENQTGYANLCRLLTAAHVSPPPSLPHIGGGADSSLSDRQSPIPNIQYPIPNPSSWPGKTPPALAWETLARHSGGLLCLSGCRQGAVARALLAGEESAAQATAARLLEIFGRERLWVEIQHHDRPDDDRLVRGLSRLARQLALPLAATGNVHYAGPGGSRLQDVLVAIRHNETLTEARRQGRLFGNSRRSLLSPQAMHERFRERPEALAATRILAERCHTSLDFSDRRLPRFPTPAGEGEFAYLYQLCHNALPRRYPQLHAPVISQLAHELAVIERAGLAGYFLIVWDIVRFARDAGIRCQGRGSAANSIVAYLLGITSIDPLAHNLLFERFLSDDKFTMPDIDIDFAADRREEVIQYVYQRYGQEHTAMVCNVVTYRRRSALRDIAKALELDIGDRVLEIVDADVKSVTASEGTDQSPISNTQYPISNPLSLLRELMAQLEGAPRHLSIHSGGMLITGPRLDEVVPLERATMPGRAVCQWDKDSVEDAGLVKIDLLGLRTLGVITETLEWIDVQEGGSFNAKMQRVEDAEEGEDFNAERRPEPVEGAQRRRDRGNRFTLGGADNTDFHRVNPRQSAQSASSAFYHLDALPLDDAELYRMLQRGDTIGTFQVESRAQQQMLPRLKPERFEDIIVEVAIVRPGPIQGGAVHPYLRRRAGQETVTYAHPSLEPVLGETLGVLLFQEQAIRVAVTAAGFSPSQADQLRRAMSRSRSDEAMAEMKQLFLAKAQAKGIDQETGEAIFSQLEGFAGFGFCKSHAASFALIAWQTMHLKRYHPAAYACALLNHQPMGFYAPEVVMEDAKRHGVVFLPPNVNRSGWGCTLEEKEPGRWGVRLGLQSVPGLGAAGWERLAAARAEGPLAGLDDFVRRAGLAQAVISDLIRAGCLDDYGERRQLLWKLGESRWLPGELEMEADELPVQLPPLSSFAESRWEYELLGLSPGGQLMTHYRDALRRAGVLSTWQVKQAIAGRRVRVGGMAVVRQRPATAGGITFLSLEDESGLLDVVIKPPVYTRCRALLHREALLLITGLVQRNGRAVSLLAGEIVGLGT